MTVRTEGEHVFDSRYSLPMDARRADRTEETEETEETETVVVRSVHVVLVCSNPVESSRRFQGVFRDLADKTSHDRTLSFGMAMPSPTNPSWVRDSTTTW